MATKPRDLVARFLSDVQGFLRGSDQMADAMEDNARDLDRLADKGETSARQLAQAFDRAGDKMKRDAKANAKETSRQFSEAGKEAGDEFAANLGESISSGDVAGLLSGTVGGLAASFGATGPIGLAVAGLGAAAIGVFSSMKASAEEAAAAAQAAFENLQSGADKLATTQTNLETAFGKGDYVSNLKEAKRLAGLLGIDQKTLLDLINDGNRGQDDYKRILAVIQELTQKNIDNAGELSTADALRVRAAQDIRDAVERTSAATNDAIKAQQETQRYLGGSADAAERRAAAEERAASALERSASAMASIYARGGSSYAACGSTYNSQLGAAAPYATGSR